MLVGDGIGVAANVEVGVRVGWRGCLGLLNWFFNWAFLMDLLLFPTKRGFCWRMLHSGAP